MSMWMRRCVRTEPGDGTAAAGIPTGGAGSGESTTAPGTTRDEPNITAAVVTA